MAHLCFICNKLLSEGHAVNVMRGIQSIKAASIERNDGHINYLNTSVDVHTECRKKYTNKNSIASLKRRRRLEESEPSTSSVSCKKRKQVYDFKKLCFFCGQAADEAAEAKKSAKYKRRISKISTLKFKDTVIKRAEERNDSLGKLVKNRVFYEDDLTAAGAKYHSLCFSKFLKPVQSLVRKPRQNVYVTQAMKEIFRYIEKHEDSQFTLAELRDVPTEYVPDDRTIISKIQQKYTSDIIITTKVGSFTIISFRDAHPEILGALETNAIDDEENDDNDGEIVELSEDDDDEEEENYLHR